MKPLLVILLVMLILLLALPMAMGMEMHGEPCPACNSTERPIALMCAAILALSVFIVCLRKTRFVLQPERSSAIAALSDLFRPPRTV